MMLSLIHSYTVDVVLVPADAISEHLQSLSDEEDLEGELDHADAMSEHLQSLLHVSIPYRLDQPSSVLPMHIQSLLNVSIPYRLDQFAIVLPVYLQSLHDDEDLDAKLAFCRRTSCPIHHLSLSHAAFFSWLH